MARLSARKRKSLKRSSFGLPGRRAYPMQDRGHAIAAKGRAKQQLRKGRLSRAQYQHIVSKANRKLGRKVRR